MVYSPHFLNIILSVVASTILGIFWYNLKVFGTQWKILSGAIINENAQLPVNIIVLKNVIALIIAISLDVIFQNTMLIHCFDKLIFAGVISIGFGATIPGTLLLWDGKPLKLYLIHSGFHVLRIFIASLIIICI